MKALSHIFFAFMTVATLKAQVPNWTVNPNDFANLMNVNATIQSDCQVNGDILAVFDENQIIRGVSAVNNGNNEFFIIVRSNNTVGETLHFAYYDSQADTILNLTSQTIQFVNNTFQGFPNPVLVNAPENTAPITACRDITAYLNNEGVATLTPNLLDNGSSDNCNIANITISETQFSCLDIGQQNVSLTVIDDQGNLSSCNSTITLLDTISPLAICQSLNIFLNESGNATISEADIDNGSTDNCTISQLQLSRTEFDCTNLGTNTVMLTVIDPYGNMSNCLALVNVMDTLAPIPNCQNVSLSLDSNGQVTLTTSQIENGSSDNCSVSLSSLSKEQFDCADLGTQSVTMTVQDQSGNSSTCQVMVTITEDLPPTAKCRSINAYLNNEGTVTIINGQINNGSLDNCTISEITLSKSTFSCADIGINSVSLTLVDQSSNSSMCSAEVTVIDTVSPTALCQEISLFLNNQGTASLSAEMINNGSTDNCTISQLQLSKTQFDCTDLGVNTVTLTAIDLYDNLSTCLAIVNVLDTLPPIPNCQNVSLSLGSDGLATLTTSQIENGSSDNCSASLRTLSKEQFGCADLGTQVVTMTVQDQSGNSSSCLVMVTVTEDLPPTPQCKSINAYLDNEGTVAVTNDQINNGSLDNCTISEITLSKSTFSCADIGINSVALTLVDQSSNSSMCSAEIAVIDTVAPTVLCKAMTIILNKQGTATLSAEMIDNGSSDNCSIASLSISKDQYNCSDIGTHEITLTVTDGSGNQNSCTTTITIIDNSIQASIIKDDFIMGPKMICPGNSDITYIALVPDVLGSVSWSYTGNGVTINVSEDTRTCTLAYSSEATSGDLIATYDGLCNLKTASLHIDLADELRCSLLSNCPFYVFLSSSDLSREGRPDIIQSKTLISVQGTLEGNGLIFRAGQGIEFRNDFEISSGSSVTALIETCQTP